MSLKQGMTTYRSHLGYDVAISFRRFKKELKKKYPINIQQVNKLRKRKVKLYTAGHIEEVYIRGFTKTLADFNTGRIILQFNYEPTYWFAKHNKHWITSSMPADYRIQSNYISPNYII